MDVDGLFVQICGYLGLSAHGMEHPVALDLYVQGDVLARLIDIG
jgi:hypothetical protein